MDGGGWFVVARFATFIRGNREYVNGQTYNVFAFGVPATQALGHRSFEHSVHGSATGESERERLSQRAGVHDVSTSTDFASTHSGHREVAGYGVRCRSR